jgi:DNA-binding CsgD family transcriptional regulator
MEAWCQAGGYVEPGVFSWQADLVEAYLLVGRTDDARAALERLRQRSARTERVWPAATIARLEGAVAADGDYADSFRQAIALFSTIPARFELAQSHLRFGERLRTAGETTAAEEHLRAAEAIFGDLEAPRWLQLTRRALGGSPVPSIPSPSSRVQLTAQERAVAELVAEGLTNKEIAARLFLTVKTIEWHLRQIYRKLGIRSRVQLATYVNGR